MLTAFDDYPLHQIPSTIDHAVSSDHRWFDRYWFAIYDPLGRFALATGLGVYKNMGVLDGFGSVVTGDRQHNVRVSRTLGSDLATIGAGPLRYDIVEGLRSFRLQLDDNAHGVAFDVRWEASAPAYEEAHHFRRVSGMVEEDFVRMYQFGRVTGHVEVGGSRFDSGDGTWFGFRDRSWGVRPGVGGAQPSRRSAAREVPAAFMIGSGFAAGDVSATWQLLESTDGTPVTFVGRLAHSNSDGVVARTLVGADHDLEFRPGTLAFERASITFTDSDGARVPAQLERLTAPFVYQGFGYFDGYADRKGLGAWRGDLVVEGEAYNVADPEHVVDESGRREFASALPLEYPVRVSIEGQTGVGDAMVMIGGPHHRYRP